MRKAGILIATALLFGCGASAGEYRGISSRSTCSSVLDSEQRLGAQLTGQRRESGASGPIDVHELAGEVDGMAVRIDVGCVGDNLSIVVYSAQVSSDDVASASFDRLRSSVAAKLGTAPDGVGSHGRRVTFACEPAELSVGLVEDLVSRGASQPGAVLLVVPRPGLC